MDDKLPVSFPLKTEAWGLGHQHSGWRHRVSPCGQWEAALEKRCFNTEKALRDGD